MHDIKKTLTGSGQVSSKTTEKLDLNTSYYFKTMCVEDDDTVKAGESKTYAGKITKVDSIGTYATSGTTFSATAEFENDGLVKLGMSVSCTITLSVVCQVEDQILVNRL